MPTITLPNTFALDDVTSASKVAENLYEPQANPDNLSVINGNLDEDNRTWTVKRDMVQPGQWSVALPPNGMSGATANIDFFEEWFVGDAWSLTTVASAMSRALAIPGTSKTFLVPWPAGSIYISWHVSLIVENDIVDTSDPALNGILLFSPTSNTLIVPVINGLELTPYARRVKTSKNTLIQRPTPADALFVDALQPDQRYYDFHVNFDAIMLNDGDLNFKQGQQAEDVTPLAPGFHTAEIRLATKSRQVRIKTCRITVIPLR